MSNFIKLIASAPDLHAYALYKLFYSFKQDFSQESLSLAAVWCIGEYGEVLFSGPLKLGLAEDGDEPTNADEIKDVTEKDVIDVLEAILDTVYSTDSVIEYVMTALLKLTTRVKSPQTVQRIKTILSRYSNNVTVELQQRSVEFLTILTDPALEAAKAGILERMPVPPPTVVDRKALQPHSTSVSPTPPPAAVPTAAASGTGNLLDDLLSLDQPSQGTSPRSFHPNFTDYGIAPAAPNNLLNQLGGLSLGPNGGAAAPNPSGMDLLADVFGSTAPAKPAAPAKNDIMALFITQTSPNKSPSPAPGVTDVFAGLGGGVPGGISATSPVGMGGVPPMMSTSATGAGEVVAYSKNGLVLTFRPSKEPGPDANSSVCSIQCVFRNSNPQSITDLNMQVSSFSISF